jgi:CHAT domain-containing protein
VTYSQLQHEYQSDLVVLSACETGMSKLFKARGAMGDNRGFQFAGAKNLLFSLWQTVND